MQDTVPLVLARLVQKTRPCREGQPLLPAAPKHPCTVLVVVVVVVYVSIPLPQGMPRIATTNTVAGKADKTNRNLNTYVKQLCIAMHSHPNSRRRLHRHCHQSPFNTFRSFLCPRCERPYLCSFLDAILGSKNDQ